MQCPLTARYRLVARRMCRVHLTTSVDIAGLSGVHAYTRQTALVSLSEEICYNGASQDTCQADNNDTCLHESDSPRSLHKKACTTELGESRIPSTIKSTCCEGRCGTPLTAQTFNALRRINTNRGGHCGSQSYHGLHVAHMSSRR